MKDVCAAINHELTSLVDYVLENGRLYQGMWEPQEKIQGTNLIFLGEGATRMAFQLKVAGIDYVFKLAHNAAGAFASNANDKEKVQYNIIKNTDLELFVLPMLETFWHRRFGTINVFPLASLNSSGNMDSDYETLIEDLCKYINLVKQYEKLYKNKVFRNDLEDSYYVYMKYHYEDYKLKLERADPEMITQAYRYEAICKLFLDSHFGNIGWWKGIPWIIDLDHGITSVGRNIKKALNEDPNMYEEAMMMGLRVLCDTSTEA